MNQAQRRKEKGLKRTLNGKLIAILLQENVFSILLYSIRREPQQTLQRLIEKHVKKRATMH